MKKVKTGLAAALLFALANSGTVQAAETEACCGGSPAAQTAAASLKKTFTNYEFEEVRETPVPGLFEVLSDQNVVYYHPDTGHLFFGELWDKSGNNLTAESRERQTAKLIADLPLDKAVRIGNGPHQVIEVTDPDCPFCRRGSEFFEGRDDVTRYVFFMPLPNHPDAPAKSRYILSASDSAAAYKRIMKGEFDGKPVPESDSRAGELLEQHRQIAARLKVNGTPAYWINGSQVIGANIGKIESLLR